jgi:hypothetical protein
MNERPLTRAEIATMWVYGDEYSKQKEGIREFYAAMSASKRLNIGHFLSELDSAEPQPCPKCSVEAKAA